MITAINSKSYINGLVIQLIDHDTFETLLVKIWFDDIWWGVYEIPHLVDVSDDLVGSTSIYKIMFKEIIVCKIVKVQIESQVIDKEFVSIKLQ